MRPASLIALVLLSACGRSSLSPPAEAGVATDHAQSTELEVGAAWVGDAAADQPGVEIETTSRCSYHAADAYVVRCGGDFRLLSVMVDGRDDCPRYFVLERTGRTYAVLDDLVSDNGCDTLARPYRRRGPLLMKATRSATRTRMEFNTRKCPRSPRAQSL